MTDLHTEDRCFFRSTKHQFPTELTIQTGAVQLRNGAEFGSAVLDAALTSTHYRDRELGGNKIREAPLNTVFAATGNNIQVRDDTMRRMAVCRMEPKDDDPEQRSGFKFPDIKRHARQNREQYLSDALTIVRAYHLAGRPSQRLKPWGSFEAWSDLIRNAVVWLGMTDPAKSRAEMASVSDGDAVLLENLLNAWRACMGETRIRLADLLRTLKESGLQKQESDLRDAIIEFRPGKNGELPTPRSLGNGLKSVRRRVVAGKMLDCEIDSHTKTMAWKIISAGSTGSCGVSPHTPYEKSLEKHSNSKNEIYGESQETPQHPQTPRERTDTSSVEIQHLNPDCNSQRHWNHIDGSVRCQFCNPPKQADVVTA